MTDELKIFGKKFVTLQVASTGGLPRVADVGLFRFMILDDCTNCLGLIRNLGHAPSTLFQTRPGSEHEVIAELESEARRIMRECLEIAAEPVLVGTAQPPTDDCIVITTDEQYRELYGKPMPKVWTGSGKKTIPLPFADTNDCEDPDD